MAVCNVVILAVFLFFFFGGRDFSLEQKEDARLIGASYMTMNNEFYTIISEEVAYRVEAEGDRMILRDPALDCGRQASQIRELLDLGISALVVAPADADSLADVLTEARDRGVKVIVVDTAVADDIPADCTITSDNYEAGVIIGKYFLQKHNTAKLVVMTHESARSARERVGGFLDTVSANENIQVVKKIECEGQVEIAMPRLQEAIDEGLDFDTVFCLNDLAAMWKTWKRKSAERLCRRCFCENGAAGRVAGRGMGGKRKPVVPRRQRKNREEERKVVLGGAWRAKRSLWCPAGREKQGRREKIRAGRGMGEEKELWCPAAKEKQGRREKIRAGRGMGEEKELWCPAAKEKIGKKRENPSRAGHGDQKEACGAPPPKKKQGRRGEIQGGRGMGEEKELWCPAVKEKTGKKRGNPRRAGHGEQKEAFGAPPPEKKQGRREEIQGGRGTGSKKKLSYPACHQ